MKDLKLGEPYKNGYLKAEVIDKCIVFRYDEISFCAKFTCQDQNQQYFELFVFNLGCNKDFNQIFSQVGIGKSVTIQQPYMIVDKEGYFVLRNDVLSNIDYE